MEKDIAIKVEGLSKTFQIPHEKINSLKGAFVNALKEKSYEEFKALDNVSFEVKKGEFFGIIGRNGSGKSTLLKLIAGVHKPDAGKIFVKGKISPFLELGIGFQPDLSGRDNIFLNGIVLGLTHRQVKEKFNDIVKFSELDRFIDQKIRNYSSGMQVRLAFSIAIHANRDILLMDEVLAVGDANFQNKCLNLFADYQKKGEKTILFVSHDLGTVQKFCDRVMLIRDGRVEFVGDPEKAVNEYLLQNMKSIEKEGGRRIGSKSSPIYIEKVEFLDSQQKNKPVFYTGEDLIVRIHYKASETVKDPMIGLAIYNQQGIQISGPNTRTSGFTLESVLGRGYVDFIIPDNPFYSGVYQFTIAIHDKEGIVPLDFKDKAYSIQIISNEANQYGVLKIRHSWKQNS